MSTQGHKRKRSLQDSPVDLTLMQQARKCLVALQEELDGVVETTSEITAIMTQVDALQAILGTAKKPKLGFSSVTKTDLTKVGIQRKFLQFDTAQLHNLLTDKRAAPEEQIQQLCTRIARIYRHVSMRYEPGARMILDAVLLAVAEICSDGDAKLPVAILPEMRIASGDGILLKNPTTSFEMWFTGSVDYGVCTYENEDQRKDRVLNADVEDVGRFAKSQIFLVEGKRLQDKPLYEFMPEAISQAASLCEVTGTKAVRFCLTDGRKWIFSVFAKDEHGRRVCYEGNSTTILEPRLDPEGRDSAWEHSIHQIVELVYHWLVAEDDPLADVLYQLED
ncbi:hypothetical protein DFH08DRAFT_892323 [Mycena albidolilacea]|uniref:Uncharacterized protein n=1 Tax=Mycena albidolilacea TaxID=1033008 RepID=A0AAD7EFZ9_9AGAR|nr:hypothetical protein DFH08DRAFT_892323 [Mycena albidolilacea]